MDESFLSLKVERGCRAQRGWLGGCVLEVTVTEDYESHRAEQGTPRPGVSYEDGAWTSTTGVPVESRREHSDR